jgi:hypothetical protein
MWTEHYHGFETNYPTDKFLYIRYEDLRNESIRVSVLNEALALINITQASTEQLQCAFILSDIRTIHRDHDTDNDYMRKEEVYTKDIVCSMWNVFGSYASLHGYDIREATNCNGTQELFNIDSLKKFKSVKNLFVRPVT